MTEINLGVVPIINQVEVFSTAIIPAELFAPVIFRVLLPSPVELVIV
jgi:hypothetical protein